MIIKTKQTTAKKESGFTLLEILIAVLVLSIGLLGLAALQVTGLKSNQSAQYRSMATMLAYDMADRIRANRTTAYAIAMDAAPAAPAVNCQDAACDTAQMAAYDMSYWKCSLGLWNTTTAPSAAATQTLCNVTLKFKGDLPLGDGSIVLNGDVYTITVQWDDERTGAAGQNFTMDFIP